MRIVLVCSEELQHSILVERLRAFFGKREDMDLLILSRNNLNHADLEGVSLYFTLGGDGTLFTLTHYLKEGFIVGIHSCGERSVGHFMGLSAKDPMERENGNLPKLMLKLALEVRSKGERISALASHFSRYQRLEARIERATGITIPVDLAFNEYAIGNDLFGRPSKYVILVHEDEGGEGDIKEEWQRSSGLITSTYHGMSGWISYVLCDHCYHGQTRPNGGGNNKRITGSDGILYDQINPGPTRYENIMEEFKYSVERDAGKFFYIVREPMDRVNLKMGFTSKLVIVSDMASGIISLDGFNEYPFERNDRIIIEMSDEPLYLLRKDVSLNELLRSSE